MPLTTDAFSIEQLFINLLLFAWSLGLSEIETGPTFRGRTWTVVGIGQALAPYIFPEREMVLGVGDPLGPSRLPHPQHGICHVRRALGLTCLGLARKEGMRSWAVLGDHGWCEGVCVGWAVRLSVMVLWESPCCARRSWTLAGRGVGLQCRPQPPAPSSEAFRPGKHCPHGFRLVRKA